MWFARRPQLHSEYPQIIEDLQFKNDVKFMGALEHLIQLDNSGTLAITIGLPHYVNLDENVLSDRSTTPTFL